MGWVIAFLAFCQNTANKGVWIGNFLCCDSEMACGGASMSAGDVTQCFIWRCDFAQVSLWVGAFQVVAGGALHWSSWDVAFSAGCTLPASLPLSLSVSIPLFFLLLPDNMSARIKLFGDSEFARLGLSALTGSLAQLTTETQLTTALVQRVCVCACVRMCVRVHECTCWFLLSFLQMRC